MAVLVVGRHVCSLVRPWGDFPHAASIRTIGGRIHYFRSVANYNATLGRGCCSDAGFESPHAITSGRPAGDLGKSGMLFDSSVVHLTVKLTGADRADPASLHNQCAL